MKLAHFLIATSVLSQDYGAPTARAGAWGVRELQQGCVIETLYADGTQLSLVYDSYTLRGYVKLGNPRWRSVQEDRAYQFLIDLPPAETLYMQGRGTPLDAPGSFSIPFEGNTFISHVMAADHMEVGLGRNVVARLSLEGSYGAALELARCNRRVLARVRPDPFAPE